MNSLDQLVKMLPFLSKLLEQAPEVPHNPSPEKTGGYLTVRRISDGKILLAVGIGSLDENKRAKYHEFSLEKANRLLTNSEHLSSWQSRDPANGKWGGAIRATKGDVIISFSGLPELLDEAVCLRLAIEFDLIDENTHNEIKGISQNQFVEPAY